ncbi:MAG: hypothetical protein ACTHQM_25805 [Thermoanaerobaculia bacterium]
MTGTYSNTNPIKNYFAGSIGNAQPPAIRQRNTEVTHSKGSDNPFGRVLEHVRKETTLQPATSASVVPERKQLNPGVTENNPVPARPQVPAWGEQISRPNAPYGAEQIRKPPALYDGFANGGAEGGLQSGDVVTGGPTLLDLYGRPKAGAGPTDEGNGLYSQAQSGGGLIPKPSPGETVTPERSGKRRGVNPGDPTLNDFWAHKAFEYNTYDTPWKGTITRDDVIAYHQYAGVAKEHGKENIDIKEWLAAGRPREFKPGDFPDKRPAEPQGPKVVDGFRRPGKPGQTSYRPGDPNGVRPPAPPPPSTGGETPSGSDSGQQPAPGGGAPGTGDDQLSAVKQAVREQAEREMLEQERGIRSRNAFNRSNLSGAGDSSLATASMNAQGDLEAKLAQLEYGAYDQLQGRELQERLAKLSSEDQRYGIDTQVKIAQIQAKAQEIAAQAQAAASAAGASAAQAAAEANAAAARYESDMRYKLGIAGLDVDREKNFFSFTNAQQGLVLEYLRTMYGISPDAFLNGSPWPGGNIIVNGGN